MKRKEIEGEGLPEEGEERQVKGKLWEGMDSTELEKRTKERDM